ncbi:hypothetical protein [Faecalibacterium sp. An122]|uniref:hypothetical protein n=1 Tax=Faecalibacterium sp. An122 TaxID=1965551 RepID=UPI0013024A32|nr:hypothetical protein [Faecalibacterium sp. An122]
MAGKAGPLLAKEKQDVPDGERPAIQTQLFSSWVRPSGRTFFIFNQEDEPA